MILDPERRFLLVDEDRAYRLLLSSLMRLQGVETDEASTPEAALTRLAERPVCSVLIGATHRGPFAPTVARRITSRYGAARPCLVALTCTPTTLYRKRAKTDAFDVLHERVFDLDGVDRLLSQLSGAPCLP